MTTLIRDAFVRGTQRYSLTIDEQYISELIAHLRRQVKEGESVPMITPDEAVQIYNYTEEERDTDTRMFTWFNGQKVKFCDIIHDWISEDLWDSYDEMVEYDTLDWEDWIDKD